MLLTRKLVITAFFIALGIVTGDIIFIPLGVSKLFPVQHLINVLTAVLVGPWYSLGCAFVISLLRNLMGTGSLLAFPGSMIGAFLAGNLFRKTRRIGWAAVGEVIGTGVMGALVSFPLAKFLYGVDSAVFYFITPFTLASLVGSLIAYFLLKGLKRHKVISDWLRRDEDGNENSTDDSRV
ncbi:energy coupling factor transporter S component ThiW [Pullulanibacillus pueri]|uniref:Energy coupling factor transporter S component ThiW n=1 Tax=Pullulanibacillus pueri TaxID=1437324 RepID=A0A8J2ZVU8_9BACL|nr:energy coupling factor transporter S component ThiW [Pullulanibacillus pueri]MBM7682399.1 energy coupling factor transporter S component ThiW [Pullulanibacillus pueri]GGH81789.1 energy coupling factor transporter S component ThiW [Pullulanibacillus pueri]